MSRSLAFCHAETADALADLEVDYDTRLPCHDEADCLRRQFLQRDIDEMFEEGPHELLFGFLNDNARLSAVIARDYRFTEWHHAAAHRAPRRLQL